MKLDVLIVDDSATIRALITKALRLSVPDLGDVHEASDGIATLAMLADHTVDLVLMDINMPRLNGMQLLKRLRDNPKLSTLPVVVISTEGSQERLAELDEFGIAGYLRKPFRPEQLRQVVNQIMEFSDDGKPQEPDGGDF
ncbi:MAG: response regulator [Phycisphaerae bacterium]|nr:response regulator [Phycisphaerae bacterium]